MIAARKGDVAIVKKLIQHGTSVNLTNKVSPVSLCTLELESKTGI